MTLTMGQGDNDDNYRGVQDTEGDQGKVGAMKEGTPTHCCRWGSLMDSMHSCGAAAVLLKSKMAAFPY